MAAPTIKARNIPHYLRRKAGNHNTGGSCDAELEKANSILHDRIVRMHRDKLCQGCARFDWARTHMYTRDVRTKSKKKKDERTSRIVKNDIERPLVLDLSSGRVCDLRKLEDNVFWSEYEVLPDAPEEAVWLARNPRFEWRIQRDGKHECMLCKSLLDAAGEAPGLPKLPANSEPTYLDVELSGGPVFEDGGKHQCLEAWPKDVSDVTRATNGFIATLTWEHLERQSRFTSCIRPLFGDTASDSDDLPHCCLQLRKVQMDNKVDLDLVTRWFQLCDTTHEHSSVPSRSDFSAWNLRFIDVQNQCIVERSDYVRYAALSYTWGTGGQYCLYKSNVDFLEQHDSLNHNDVSLRKVIVDAIEVCARTGIPYLWVDALCIVQDDAQGKKMQIQCMDSIYSGAYITIIAAAEKVANVSESATEPTGDAGLPRMSMPGTRIKASFTMDGVSYLTGSDDIFQTLNANLSGTKWFSRGWTLQELVLSHRIIAFVPEGVTFYCSHGYASETLCLGDNTIRTLPPIAQYGLESEHSFQMCGLLHTLSRQNTTVVDFVELYEKAHVPLLRSYIGRHLSFQTDALGAFSGILAAEFWLLDGHHLGLPERLFARALFLSIPSKAGALSRRFEILSWTWIGWKLEVSAVGASLDDGGHQAWLSRRRVYWPLVQIYSHTFGWAPKLMLGPLDLENGVEGFCVRSIELYNRIVPAPPLPKEPTIETGPRPPTLMSRSHFPTLMFWTHVASLKLSEPLDESIALEVHIDCPEARDRIKSDATAEFEVALVAITHGGPDEYPEAKWEPVRQPWDRGDGEHELSGIIIERWRGPTRRIGVVHRVGIQQWIAAEPKIELLLLV